MRSHMTKELTFNSFNEFYPYYLSEHSNKVCRNLHYVGSSLVIVMALFSILSGTYILLWSLPVIGYGFAWLGHFLFEHNKPATFKWPFWSLSADWVMFFQFLTGKLPSEHFVTQQHKNSE